MQKIIISIFLILTFICSCSEKNKTEVRLAGEGKSIMGRETLYRSEKGY